MDNLAQGEPPDGFPATKLGAAPGNAESAESEVATPRSGGEKRAVELLEDVGQGGATPPKSPRMHVHAGVEDHLRDDLGDTVESFKDEFENSETRDEVIPDAVSWDDRRRAEGAGGTRPGGLGSSAAGSDRREGSSAGGGPIRNGQGSEDSLGESEGCVNEDEPSGAGCVTEGRRALRRQDCGLDDGGDEVEQLEEFGATSQAGSDGPSEAENFAPGRTEENFERMFPGTHSTGERQDTEGMMPDGYAMHNIEDAESDDEDHEQSYHADAVNLGGEVEAGDFALDQDHSFEDVGQQDDEVDLYVAEIQGLEAVLEEADARNEEVNEAFASLLVENQTLREETDEAKEQLFTEAGEFEEFTDRESWFLAEKSENHLEVTSTPSTPKSSSRGRSSTPYRQTVSGLGVLSNKVWHTMQTRRFRRLLTSTNSRAR